MIRWWSLAIVLLAVDRFIKVFFWQHAADFQSVAFLNVIVNRQGPFSLPWTNTGAIIIAVILLVVVFWQWLISIKLKINNALFWTLILVGAVSNLWDRLTIGAVIDYIDLGWWPVFNFSDCLIVVGLTGLLWSAYRPAATVKDLTK